jgi:hypothetical protein
LEGQGTQEQSGTDRAGQKRRSRRWWDPEGLAFAVTEHHNVNIDLSLEPAPLAQTTRQFGRIPTAVRVRERPLE